MLVQDDVLYWYKNQQKLLMANNEMRHQLGEFIRLHRHQIPPESAGFSGAGRRRTPGLRREELAQLCRVSVTWLTWLEQGREVAASVAMLTRLAQALHLTTAERAYLFELAARPDQAQARAPDTSPVTPVLRSVAQMACPAYVLDRRWDVVAANPQARLLFLDWGAAVLTGTPNLLRFLFRYTPARALIEDWETRCARLVAEFRADCGRDSEDPTIREVIEELSAASADFAGFWRSKAVLAREGGERRFRHPQQGMQIYEQITLRPAIHRELKMVMLLPAEIR